MSDRPFMDSFLIDERSAPSLRDVLGGLLARAETADFAIARMRLAGIDLSSGELSSVRRCRVLLGRLDADTFGDAADALHSRRQDSRASLIALRDFIDSGRLEVRSAGLHAWTPDFSVLDGLPDDGPGRAVALVGAHYFGRPGPPGGPALTCVVTGRAEIDRARTRFRELWARAYDVRPVVREMIESILTRDDARAEP